MLNTYDAPKSILETGYILFNVALTTKRWILDSLFCMRKLSLREVRRLVQGHPDKSGQAKIQIC